MNHQSLTQRLFRFFPALFTLTALGLVGWAVVDRPAPSTTAAAVSLTTTSAADGTLPAAGADVRRRIEDIRVGDRVWAYDEQTGQLEKRPVTALFRSQTDHLRVLTLESGSGERQRIETTDEHPFWVDGYGWQDAQLLRPGDRLLEPDQSHVTVISSVREEHPDGLTVYNFEVAGLHDYFVSATATDSLVLSHNMCRKTSGGAVKSEGPFVYRGLARGEDPTVGLTARAPGAGNSEISHVAGKRQSQWISTTKDEATAIGKYGEHGIVRIDLSKVPSNVSDVSGGFPNGGRMSNWAKRDREVLIQGSVPAEAITGIK